MIASMEEKKNTGDVAMRDNSLRQDRTNRNTRKLLEETYFWKQASLTSEDILSLDA